MKTTLNPSDLSTARAFTKERERFIRLLDANGAAAPYLGVIIGPLSDAAFTQLRTMPGRMADAAAPRGLRFRIIHFDALRLTSTFGPSDAKQAEFNLTQAQRTEALPLPALVGFNEALASFDTDVPGFRADAIILAGSAFQQDPEAAQTTALRLRERGTKLYCFQEGSDPLTGAVFQHLAAITGGRYARIGAPLSLEELCIAAVRGLV